MISFYVCIVFILILTAILIGAVFYFTNSGPLVILTFMITLGIGFWVNPDLLRWYQFDKEQQSIAKAKSILKNPNALNELLTRLQQRVKKYPNDSKAWFLLGRIYAGNNQWDKAHDALLQAYRLEPKNIKTALFFVESIWHTQGQISLYGRDILLKILAQEPHQPDTLMLLATEAQQRHCPKEALGYLKTLRNMFAAQEDLRQSIDEAILKAKQDNDNHCQIVIDR